MTENEMALCYRCGTSPILFHRKGILWTWKVECGACAKDPDLCIQF